MVTFSPCLPVAGAIPERSGRAFGVIVNAFGKVTTSVPVLTVMLRAPVAALYWMGRAT
jgi:hypothetical protein